MEERNGVKKVLAFGVFDGLHDGHRHFLREARKCGDHLVVAVAHDEAVVEIKGRAPRQDAAARSAAILSERLADEVVIGDPTPGSWEVLRKYRPSIIALGYDQETLRVGLDEIRAEFSFAIAIISAHKPEILHSSIIRHTKQHASHE